MIMMDLFRKNNWEIFLKVLIWRLYRWTVIKNLNILGSNNKNKVNINNNQNQNITTKDKNNKKTNESIISEISN